MDQRRIAAAVRWTGCGLAFTASAFMIVSGILRVLGICDFIERGGSTLSQGYAAIGGGIFMALVSLVVFWRDIDGAAFRRMLNRALQERSIERLSMTIARYAQSHNQWQFQYGGGWSYFYKLPEPIGTHQNGTPLAYIRVMLDPNGLVWSVPSGPSVDMSKYQVETGRWSGMIDLTEIVCETKEKGDECGWDNHSYSTLAILVSQAIDISNGHTPVASWKPSAFSNAGVGKEKLKPRAWIDISDVVGDSFNYAYVWTEVDRSGDELNPDGAVVCTWGPLVFVQARYESNVKWWLKRWFQEKTVVVPLDSFNDKVFYCSNPEYVKAVYPGVFDNSFRAELGGTKENPVSLRWILPHTMD